MNDFLKEKELLLDSIENNTSEHWKNYYKDVPVECIYDDLVIDINEIKRLQNNWNELKKWLEEEIKRYRNTLSERPTNDIEYNNSCVTSVALEQVKVVLSKMQELEDMNGQKSKNVK